MKKNHYLEIYFRCPYCGEADNDSSVEVNANDKVFECANCKNRFMGSATIVYTSKMDCELNGKTHDFSGGILKGFPECIHCEVDKGIWEIDQRSRR